jgi:hypothetical protein
VLSSDLDISFLDSLFHIFRTKVLNAPVSNVNLLFSENIGNHACREQKLMGPVPYLETRLRFSPVGETALWEVEEGSRDKRAVAW